MRSFLGAAPASERRQTLEYSPNFRLKKNDDRDHDDGAEIGVYPHDALQFQQAGDNVDEHEDENSRYRLPRTRGAKELVKQEEAETDEEYVQGDAPVEHRLDRVNL